MKRTAIAALTCWIACQVAICVVVADDDVIQASSSVSVTLPRLDEATMSSAQRMAETVTIYRDEFGTPHIDAPTDAAVLFGLAYAQAEDNFWQVEDNYILSLGRYSEVHGPAGLNSDILNRAFEVVPRSKSDFAQRCDPVDQKLAESFVAGLNYYLAKNPQVRPRLITKFEPWHVLAFNRHVALELCFRYTGLSNSVLPRSNPRIWAASGSNAWAIAPSKTQNGNALLLVNPHLPQFGFSQLYEAHLRSGEGLNIAGAMFFGNPLPSLGHNEHLGWTFTTNEPNIADVWRVRFDDGGASLRYRFGAEHREAVEWSETIKVRGINDASPRKMTFRKTHHGPVVSKRDNEQYLVAQVSDIFNLRPMRQAMRMAKARNMAEFRSALAMMQIPFMNVLYADRDGNILYFYGGVIPRRQAEFDSTKPLDGNNPRTSWQGFHRYDELPELVDPKAGYLQNCNSSPFTTTHLDNPDRQRFPAYLFGDADDDKRRAKQSRLMLQASDDWTIESLERAAFDTTVYWAKHEMPQFLAALDKVETIDPQLAEEARPLVACLREWDGCISADCEAATLCTAWYAKMYGNEYPGEKLYPGYVNDPLAQIEALVIAGESLERRFGAWRVKWSDIHRLQRHARMIDPLPLPFDDDGPSLPLLGGHGPMGVVFTQYYSPVLKIPFIETAEKHYALVGPSYMAVYEFGDRFRGASAVVFGSSADPKSPNYFDQAELISKRRLKPELFEWTEVTSSARCSYHPGEAAAARGGSAALPAAR